MSEVLVEVRTYEARYQCDVCRKGFMRPTGEMYQPAWGGPELFIHVCDNKNCLQGCNLGRRYPCIVHETK